MKLPPLPDVDWDQYRWALTHTREELRNYGIACAKAALEQASLECRNIAIAPSNVTLGVAMKCADAIRALAKEITP